jgi:hypothetical protein
MIIMANMNKLLIIFTLLLANKMEAKTFFALPYSISQSISEEQKIEKLIKYVEKVRLYLLEMVLNTQQKRPLII